MNAIGIKQKAIRLAALLLTLLLVGQSFALADHVHTNLQDESTCELCPHNHQDAAVPVPHVLSPVVARLGYFVPAIIASPITVTHRYHARAPPTRR